MDAGVFAGFARACVAGAGSRGSSDGDCATVRSEPRLGLSSARPGARDRRAQQFSDRRPSPVTAGGYGTGAAYLDRNQARSDPDRVTATAGATGYFDQDRRSVAPAEQMESHLQKK